MQRWLVVGLVVVVLSALSTPTAKAQFTQSPNDLGAADTVEMVITLRPDVTTNKRVLQLDLYVFNDANNVASASIGHGWLNTTMRMDSAFVTPLTNSAFNLSTFLFFANSIDSTNKYDRFPFAGARLTGNGVALGPTRRLWARYFFSVSSWAGCDSIAVDTFTYNAGVTYKFVDNLNRSYAPFWKTRVLVRDTTCVPPANILINPDTLVFNATVGGGNPTNQFTSVTSSGAPLSLTLTESIPWLTRSPGVGTTPLNVNIGVTIVSLAAGTYFDSIQVTAPNTLNSPEYIYVQLNLAEPAPTLSVTPMSLNFNALIGQPLPPPQIVTVKNVGGNTLNWTATKSSAWLSISPSSGIDSGGISVSIDTTGLSAGDYFDTIVVSDPAATNNPKTVTVKLSLGTSLPTIETDSSTLVYIVNTAEGIIFSRSFEIRNAGVGSLTYNVTESSSRILSLTNPGGSAPGTVTLNYKLATNANGLNFFDTVMITSPEAVNSPYMQIIELRCRTNPAVVRFDLDTVSLQVFECQQGSVDLPFVQFQVLNQGFDNPMEFTLSTSSDFFTLDRLNGEAPDIFTLFALDAGRPVGTYYDTIIASAVGSINKFDTLYVKYDVVPGTVPFTLLLDRFQLVVPYQEESGPQSESGVSMYRPAGGCANWKITENVDWIFPDDPDSGSVPADFKIIIDAPGYVFGEYPDTMIVTSPGASNSPIKVPVKLRVWRFHGDLNYDLSLDIADLTQYVFFLFMYDPIWNPQPTLLVADLNCDDSIDIADLTYMVEYLFVGGPIPCGNPY